MLQRKKEEIELNIIVEYNTNIRRIYNIRRKYLKDNEVKTLWKK
jgi:uncharacterized alkaline shock family protein YloU